MLIKLSAAHNADATSGLLMLEDQLLISIASFLSIHDLGCGFSRVCRRVVKSKIVETAAQLQLGLEPQYMQQWVQQIQAQQKLSPLRLLAAAHKKKLYLQYRVHRMSAKDGMYCTAGFRDPFGEPRIYLADGPNEWIS